MGEDAPGDEAAGDDETGPVRRCIVTGERQSPERMIRFVVGPDDKVVADVAESLPGRGMWLSAARDVVNTAAAKNPFARAARRKVMVPRDLADQVEALLTRRCLEIIGLARRAGQVVAGFEKVRALLKGPQAQTVALLLEANDAAADGRGKIGALRPELPVVDLFDRDELGRVMGRDQAVHVAMLRGRLAERLTREAARLQAVRAPRETAERNNAERKNAERE